MKKFDVVGMDRGYEYVKMVFGKGEEDRIIFPSITAKERQSVFDDQNNADKRINISKEKIDINYNGTNYLIGEEAIRAGRNHGSKNYQDDKFKAESETAKMLAGVALKAAQLDEKEIVIDRLISGLNIANFGNYKDDLVQELEGNYQFDLPSGATIDLIINNAHCVVEGLGAYQNKILDLEGNKRSENIDNDRIGIIDIGGRSVDYFIVESLKTVQSSAGSLNLGMNSAFQEVASKLYENVSPTIIDQEFCKGKSTIYWDGDIDIGRKCRKAFQNLAEELHGNLVLGWDDHLKRVRKIILCGGGAEHLGEYMSDLFSQDVIIVENPQFSNCLGFYKIGVKNYKD